jgi:hypothetical protein
LYNKRKLYVPNNDRFTETSIEVEDKNENHSQTDSLESLSAFIQNVGCIAVLFHAKTKAMVPPRVIWKPATQQINGYCATTLLLLGVHMTSCWMSSQNMVLPALEAVADVQHTRVSRRLAAATVQVPLDSLP